MSSVPSVAWSALLPPFLTEPWRRFHNGIDEPPERVGRAIGLVDALVRYLSAVFWAARPDGVTTPKTAELWRRIDRPTLGMWAQGAVELAELQRRGSPGPVRAAAEALLEDHVKSALRAVIDARNRVAHSASGSMSLDKARANVILGELEPALRAITDAFAVLGDAALLWERNREQLGDGTVRVELIRLGGRDPVAFPPITLSRFLVPSKRAFLLEPSGRALLLDPFVRVLEPDDPQACLLYRVDGERLVFTTPRGEAPMTGAADLPERTAWEGAIPQKQARKLTDALPSGPPEIPGWTLEARLGEGATATVWRGQGPEGVAALKVVRAERIDERTRQRLRRELEQGLGLQHPNLVRSIGQTTTADGHVVLIQELADGPTLASLLASDEPLSIGRAVAYCADLLRALECLHERGVIHRDVKPANIAVGATGARLLDLGLAAVSDDLRLTRTSEGLGTLGFSAPEQLRGGPIDARADLYAAGRVLGACLDVVERSGASYAGIRAIVRLATHEDPANRYPTARGMREALEDPAVLQDQCPVGVGDLVHDTFRVTARGERVPNIDGTVWLLDTRSPDHTRWAVFLATDDLGSAWLRAVLESGRHAAPMRTSDGFVYVPLTLKQASEAVRRHAQPPDGAVGAGAVGAGVVGAGAALGGAAMFGAAAAGLAALAGGLLASAATRAARTPTPSPKAAPPPKQPAPPPTDPAMNPVGKTVDDVLYTISPVYRIGRNARTLMNRANGKDAKKP